MIGYVALSFRMPQYLRWIPALLFFSLVCSTSAAQEEGQSKLEEATERKLNAESPADLAKVIELCEQAIELGLDEISGQMAKSMLAASALQRAQLMIQNLPRVVNNPNALRNLTAAMRADLEKAIENNPNLADAHMLLARLETLPGGSRDRALNHMNQAIEALKDKPVNQAGAYVLRAGLQSSNADKLADLSKALELDPTNTDAWQAKIVLQLALGKVEEAARDAEKLLEDDEGNKFAFQVAIEAFIELERLQDAYELLSRRIEKDSENSDNFRWRGRVALLQEKAEEAMQDLNEAIRLNPRDSEALMLRGQLYLTMDEVDKANRDISDSLLIQPESVQGVLMRSLISAREGRYADAISDMETLVRFNPNNRAWILQLAAFYQMDQRPRLAIQVLDDLLSNDPKDWRALRTRGDAKLSIGQHKDAVEDYRRAVGVLEANDDLLSDAEKAEDVDYSGLFNNLSWLLSTSTDDSLRNGEEALDLALKACEATEYQEAHILSTLAAAYAETGNFEKARHWAQKAVELGQGQGHEQLEQLEEELKSYEEEKPWREEQTIEENLRPVSPGEPIDT